MGDAHILIDEHRRSQQAKPFRYFVRVAGAITVRERPRDEAAADA
jgi:hypothetical protein